MNVTGDDAYSGEIEWRPEPCGWVLTRPVLMPPMFGRVMPTIVGYDEMGVFVYKSGRISWDGRDCSDQTFTDPEAAKAWVETVIALEEATDG